MQISLRMVMPWPEVASWKVVGLNPDADKSFYLQKIDLVNFYNHLAVESARMSCIKSLTYKIGCCSTNVSEKQL